MASSLVVKITCVMLLCMVAWAPIAQAAISCGQMNGALFSCLSYLTGTGALTPACCNGVQSVNAAATTTPDRQQACNCLKQSAATITGINFNLAEELPSKCGVNIPYKISPSTDCAGIR